METNK
jgi:hypothetical protein